MSTIGPHMSSGPGSAGKAPPAAGDQTLGPLLAAITRHWLLVIVLVGLSVGIAAKTMLGREAAYETSASVLVKPLPPNDPTYIGIGTVVDSVDPVRTVQTAAALLSTPDAAEAAAKALGPGWTRERVQNSVHVTPRGQSYVLAVTAQAPTAKDAARLANAYTNAALNARTEIVQMNLNASIGSLGQRLNRLKRGGADAGQIVPLSSRLEDLLALQAIGTDPSLQLSQPADVPVGSIGTSRVLVGILAVTAGLILGGMAALALEFFTRRVRDEDEIARLYPIPILVGIPKIGRLGWRRQINPRAMPPDVFEQIRLLRVQLPMGELPTSLIVTSANSGDGKTTVAVALATAMAQGEQNVILMDLDVHQQGATGVLGVPRPVGQTPDVGGKLAIQLERLPGMPRLSVMPAPMYDSLALEAFIDRLPDLMAQAKQLASYVIVDAAPVGEVSDALRIATACDRALFVVRPRHTDRSRLILTRDMLTRAGITPVGIVVVGQGISGSSGRYYGYQQAASDLSHQSSAMYDEETA